jgi:hypothetical protein
MFQVQVHINNLCEDFEAKTIITVGQCLKLKINN